MFWTTLILLLLPATALLAQTAPPAEVVEQLPNTSRWAFGWTLAGLVGAVAIIARMVSRNVDRALRHNEDEIRCVKADVRAIGGRLTTLEAEHRIRCHDHKED